MSEIEDEVRAAMIGHEHEAPSAAQFRFRAPARRRGWVPAVAAACLVLALAIGVFVWRTHGSTPPASRSLSCPQQYQGAEHIGTLWVPSKASGVDGRHRLVPDATPQRIVVCGYLGQVEGALTGQQVLRNPAAAVHALTWLPGDSGHGTPCTFDLQPLDSSNFLIGVRYAAGTVWVSAPGSHCAFASNGQFTAAANLREPALAAYRSGTWHPRRLDGPCATGTGRLGQEAALVPPGASSLTICTEGPVAPPTPVTVHDFQALQESLAAATTSSRTGSCGATGPVTSYLLDFHYPAGPDVSLSVDPACGGLDNGSLSATATPRIESLIKQLVNRR